MVRDVTDDATLTNHQRHQKLFGLLHDRDKEVAQAFDNPRRSVAFQLLCIICSWGLLSESKLSEFSEQIKFLLGERLAATRCLGLTLNLTFFYHEEHKD